MNYCSSWISLDELLDASFSESKLTFVSIKIYGSFKSPEGISFRPARIYYRVLRYIDTEDVIYASDLYLYLYLTTDWSNQHQYMLIYIPSFSKIEF